MLADFNKTSLFNKLNQTCPDCLTTFNAINTLPSEQRTSVITTLATGATAFFGGLVCAFKCKGFKAKATALLVSSFGATVIISQLAFFNLFANMKNPLESLI